MPDRWPDTPFAEQVRLAMDERGWGLRALSRHAGVDPGHLSRALRRADGKRPGLELMRAVAAALALRPEDFPEYRAELLRETVRTDPEIRDRLFERLTRLR